MADVICWSCSPTLNRKLSLDVITQITNAANNFTRTSAFDDDNAVAAIILHAMLHTNKQNFTAALVVGGNVRVSPVAGVHDEAAAPSLFTVLSCYRPAVHFRDIEIVCPLR